MEPDQLHKGKVMSLAIGFQHRRSVDLSPGDPQPDDPRISTTPETWRSERPQSCFTFYPVHYKPAGYAALFQRRTTGWQKSCVAGLEKIW